MITLGLSQPSSTYVKSVDVPGSVQKVVVVALPMVLHIDAAPQGGEWKRHQVYAALLKAFPASGRDDIAFAVEIAVRKMKGKLWR